MQEEGCVARCGQRCGSSDASTNLMRSSYVDSLGRIVAVGHGLRRHGDCL